MAGTGLRSECVLCASTHFHADLVSVMIPWHQSPTPLYRWPVGAVEDLEPSALLECQPVRSSLEC